MFEKEYVNGHHYSIIHQLSHKASHREIIFHFFKENSVSINLLKFIHQVQRYQPLIEI